MPRHDDSYCEARERGFGESASGLAGHGTVSHVAESTEERVLVSHTDVRNSDVTSGEKDMAAYAS